MNGRAVIAFAALLSAGLLPSSPVRADFKVWLPEVNFGELAVESVGDRGFDANASKSGEFSSTFELEYGVTPWWQTELELEFNRAPGRRQATYFDQITSENLFQFTERGEYWLDFGLFYRIRPGVAKGQPERNHLRTGVPQGLLGHQQHREPFVEKDLGANAASGLFFLYAFETRIDAWTFRLGRSIAVEPGLQYYGAPGRFGRFDKWSDQDQRVGPQLFGKIFNLGPGTLEWNGGLLFGLTRAVPLTTLRWQAEYEIHF